MGKRSTDQNRVPIDPALLSHIPLFALLDAQGLQVLAENLDYKRYLAGQTIFSAGDTGSTMYIVSTGEVELWLRDEDGERVTLQRVQPGQMFGELALLDDEPRSASAIATQNAGLYIVDRQDLQMLVRTQPDAALDMLAMLGRRVREANQLVRQRTARNVNAVFEERKLGLGERLSDMLTGIAGHIYFVYFCIIWFAVWIALNSNLLPGLTAFDPFPYGLLTMIVSLLAIFLSLFVLISQNRQAERDRVRNDIEYEVNLKAELEIRTLMRQVEELQKVVIQHIATNSDQPRRSGDNLTAE
jgi:uncharacterized membrane protein